MEQQLVSELIANQLPEVIPLEYKLDQSDMVRLAPKLSGSIFNPVLCVYWEAGLYKNSASHRQYKGVHIDFYLNSTKRALHRILYANYCGALDRQTYLRCTCANPCGRCLNVSHYRKVEYTTAIKTTTKTENRHPPPKEKKGKKALDKTEIQIKPIVFFDISFS